MYQPHAQSVELIDENGNSMGMFTKLDERGFFQINLGPRENFKYKLKIDNDINQFYTSFAIRKLMSPQPGNVKIQVRTMSFTTEKLIAESLLEAPTPMIADVFV